MNKIVLILLAFSFTCLAKKEETSLDSLKFRTMQWPGNSEFPSTIEMPSGDTIKIDSAKITVLIFADTNRAYIDFYAEYLSGFIHYDYIEVIYIIESEKELKDENRFLKQYKKYYYNSRDFRKKYLLGYLPMICLVHNNKMGMPYRGESDEFKTAFVNYFIARLDCFE